MKKIIIYPKRGCLFEVIRLLLASVFAIAVSSILIGLVGGIGQTVIRDCADLDDLSILIIPMIFIGSLILAHFLFNLPRETYYSLDDYLAELKKQGCLENRLFKAKRAFGVEDSDGTGLIYFLELEDNSVLYLNGLYLHESELDYATSKSCLFPSTEFQLVLDNKNGYLIQLNCSGSVLEPEFIAHDFRNDDLIDKYRDWQVISDCSYDEIRKGFKCDF